MATIRAHVTTTGACSCGGLMVRARRYEATRTVRVLCCWSCGREDPPMVVAAPAPVSFPCRYCGEPFVQLDLRERYCSDDHLRRSKRIETYRRQDARRIERPA